MILVGLDVPAEDAPLFSTVALTRQRPAAPPTGGGVA
jgi:hypothetical protein